MSGVGSSPSGYRWEGRREWGTGSSRIRVGSRRWPRRSIASSKNTTPSPSARTEGEPLGSLDLESGVTTIQTTWSRKKPEIGQLLDQMATGLFAAARVYGWTEEQARRDVSDNPDGSTPGGSQRPGGGGGGAAASGSPGGGMSP